MLIGSQRPSLLCLPADRRGSAGPEVVDLAAMAGLVLDDWQAWCLEVAMSEQSDGRWSAFEVGIEVGRQNGKGSILEARQLGGLTILRERLQVHTAHEFKTCFEHFLRMVTLVESNPEIDRQVMRVRRGAGEQAIEMRGGQRLRFMARTNSSGRGLTGDVVYLDEAFALTAQMMGALLPTLSSRPNPQLWYMSSAPMSTSAVQHGVRRRAEVGEARRLFYAGWSNGQDVDIDDREALVRSTPALGIRIWEETIDAERDALRATPGEFMRERLGVPDPEVTADEKPVKLPQVEWLATAKPASRAPAREGVRLAFDVAPDGAWSSVAVAVGTLSAPWVQLIEHRQGVGWLPEFVAAKCVEHDVVAVSCDGIGPAGSELPRVREALEAAGFPVDRLRPLTSGEYRAACGAFYADVVEGRLGRPAAAHGEKDVLDVAAADAAEKRVGDGWLWDRRRATVPVSPLVAVTVARSLLAEVPGVAEAIAIVL